MKKTRKILGLVVALAMIVNLIPTMAFAETTSSQKLYDSMAIYGDSICLGFNTESANMTDNETFNISKNATGNVFPNSYPSVAAKAIGLNPTADLRNYGVCAAWAKDMYSLMSDPTYNYQYYAPYDENTTYVLPEDYDGVRVVVTNKDKPGYDDTDPGTWVYSDDYTQLEDFHLDAGTTVKVAYKAEYEGFEYTALNPVISEKFYYVSKNDKTKFYPTVFNELTFMYEPDESAENVAALGHAIVNPIFSTSYFDEINDTIKSAELQVLAIGGNDIYHTFNDYQMQTGTVIGDVIGTISSMLQMGITFDDVAGMFDLENFDPSMFEMLAAAQGGAALLSTPVSETGTEGDLSQLIGSEDIAKLLKHYSKDNVKAYYNQNVLPEYKEYYEKCIQYILANKRDSSDLVLMGNYNPFGMVNYMQMLAQNLQEGTLAKNASTDAKTITTILKAIIGSPEDYEKLLGMSEEELKEAVNLTSDELLELAKKIQKHEGMTNEEITKLFNHLTFPAAVVFIGPALSGVYEEMNDFVQDMADKYGLAYVDISNAPASGRYDPHPTDDGNKWIAEKLVAALTPTIKASISCEGTGKGVVTCLGTTTLRLNDSKTYKFTPALGSKVSAVYIDGKLIDPLENPDVYKNKSYTFDKVTKNHTIEVQFDSKLNAKVLGTTVLNSYAVLNGTGYKYASGDMVYINAGEKYGYEFAGWVNVGKTPVRLKNVNAAKTCFVMPKGHVRLMATWELVDYKLTFDTNGGSAIDPVYGTIKSAAVSLDEYVTTRDHYTFDGWYSDAELTTPVDSVKLNKDQTVYAKWTPIEYTLTFESNGGTTFDPIKGNVESDPVDLAEYVPTKEHYDFDGWYTDAEFTNKVTSVEMNKDQTLYAKWTPTQYTLTFDVNGGTAINPVKGNVESDPVNLSKYSTSKKHYTFEGWYSDAGLNNKVTSVDLNKNQTVYAKWTPVEYTITFEANGGSAVSPVKGNVESAAVNLANYTTTKEHYTFDGWYSDATLKNKVTSLELNKNQTVYAKWTPVEYTLTFDVNGGTAVSPVKGNIESAPVNLANYRPTKNGYVLLGWYSDANLTQQVTSVTLNKNQTVYAKWATVAYTLTFVTNGGTSIDPVSGNVESAPVDLAAYVTTRDYYDFEGWYSDAKLSKAVANVTLNKDQTVYAKWTATKYTLTFETNGGNDIDPVVGTVLNKAVKLVDYKPVKKHYVFEGWYSDAELTKKITSAKFTKDRTVYANWTPVKYTVKFVTNGGTTINPVSGNVESASIDLADYTTTRKCYTFEGWYSDAKLTKPIDTVDFNKNQTVYAKWTPNGYTLTFETNGGNTIDPIVGTADKKAVNLSKYKPVKKHYVFEGWYSDAELTKKITSVKFTKDRTVYAKWTPAKYTVKFVTNGGSQVKSVKGTIKRADLDLSNYKSTKKGFKFLGWCSDAKLTKKIETVEFNKNQTVYANWKVVKAPAKKVVEDKTPITGDTSNIFTWILLALGAAIATVLVGFKKKTNK